MRPPQQMADGVWRLSQPVGPLINAYLAGDVLVDAGRRQDGRRILGQLAGRALSLVVLTHAHPDHQGSASAICDAREVPLACHRDAVAAMEGREPMGASSPSRFITRIWGGPPRPVERVLHEDDEVAGFRVVHAPGHSPGDIVLFRAADGVAICGDVIRNISYLTGRGRLATPPPALTADPARNRDAIRRLAALEPSLILPGHGGPVTDMRAFARFAAALP